MDRTIVLSAAILVGLAVNTNAGDQAMDHTGFSRIDASAGVIVDILVGDTYSVSADARRDRDLDRLRIRKEGDTLVIAQKSGKGFVWGLASFVLAASEPARVTVNMPDLSAIKASSGAEVKATGAMPGDLSIHASSGADLTVKGLTGGALNLHTSSGAELILEGSCQAATIRASSGSELDAEDLACGSVIARASSGASVDTRAEKRIIASASSGGDIRVHGDPAIREIDTSVSGDVNLMN